MRYIDRDKVIKIAITVIVLVLVIVCFITMVSVAMSVVNSKNDEDSFVSEYIDFIPPESELPKDLGAIRELVSSELKSRGTDNIKITNSTDDVFIIESVSDDSSNKLYIEYSKVYDCTTVKTSLEDEVPIKILYHYEYDSAKDMIDELIDFVSSYSFSSKVDVTMVRDENGEIKVSIKE